MCKTTVNETSFWSSNFMHDNVYFVPHASEESAVQASLLNEHVKQAVVRVVNNCGETM